MKQMFFLLLLLPMIAFSQEDKYSLHLILRKKNWYYELPAPNVLQHVRVLIPVIAMPVAGVSIGLSANLEPNADYYDFYDLRRP